MRALILCGVGLLLATVGASGCGSTPLAVDMEAISTPTTTPVMFLNVEDTISLGDTPSLILPPIIEIEETVGFTDEASVKSPVEMAKLYVEETIGFTDEASVVLPMPPVEIAVDDAVKITDGASVFLPVYIEIVETIAIADATSVY